MITDAGTQASKILTSSHQRAQEGATQVVTASTETLNTRKPRRCRRCRPPASRSRPNSPNAGEQAIAAVNDEVQAALSAADEQVATLTAQVASAQVDQATAAEIVRRYSRNWRRASTRARARWRPWLTTS